MASGAREMSVSLKRVLRIAADGRGSLVAGAERVTRSFFLQ